MTDQPSNKITTRLGGAIDGCPPVHPSANNLPDGLPETAYIVVHQHYHPSNNATRPSHYTPASNRPTDSGLAEVAKWGLCSLTALLAVWMLAVAITAWSNSVYWQNERQQQRIWNHPGPPAGET